MLLGPLTPHTPAETSVSVLHSSEPPLPSTSLLLLSSNLVPCCIDRSPSHASTLPLFVSFFVPQPANIFLCQNDLLKIGDLGIAKALNRHSFARTQIGTPCYMAPEVRGFSVRQGAQTHQSATHRSHELGTASSPSPRHKRPCIFLGNCVVDAHAYEGCGRTIHCMIMGLRRQVQEQHIAGSIPAVLTCETTPRHRDFPDARTTVTV